MHLSAANDVFDSIIKKFKNQRPLQIFKALLIALKKPH
jgi:hypothetical protein